MKEVKIQNGRTIAEKQAYERLKNRRFNDVLLSVEEVDYINKTTPKLSREEKKLERMYERPVNDTELLKKLIK